MTSTLTPVARNVLLVLMAENRPLKERAEIERFFGVSMVKRHRTALHDSGFIMSTAKPWTHSITEAGRNWVSTQMANFGLRKKGPTPLLAMCMYARRNGINFSQIFGETTPYQKVGEIANGDVSAARPTENVLPSGRTQDQMLQDAAFVEVDEALALLLQDQPVLDKALKRLNQKAAPSLLREIEGAERAVALVLQWARRAAQKRAIAVVSGQGDEVEFDPLLYESDEPTKAGTRVRVTRAPVVRKTKAGDLVIARGLVSAVD